MRNILFEVCGLESSTFHRESVYPVDDGFETYPFVKTHELPSTLSEFKLSIPAVYLVRDGRDAVCSMAHHRTDIIAPGSDYEQNLREAIIADRGSFFGGWSKNAEEWLCRADLIIRYEDLIQNPIATVEKLRKVYALPRPIEKNLPTFEALKFGIPKYGAGLDLDISKKEKLKQSSSHFRRGKSGGWKEDMPENLHDLYWSFHGETMEKYGYSRSGEMHKLNSDFDSVLQKKLGVSSTVSPPQYRVLIESNKIVSPDNDGVKRYQVELLKALLPVVENSNSNWEIDLYIHGKICALLDCKDILFEGFSAGKGTATAQLLRSFATTEQKLVALVPRRFVRWLAKHNITMFHCVYELLCGLLFQFVQFFKSQDFCKNRQTRRNSNNDIDVNEFESYDLVHIPLKQNYAPFRNAKNRILLTIHDLTHLYFPDHHTRGNVSNADQGIKFAIDRKAHLIAISQSTKDDILASTSILDDKIHLIYEAADRNKFNFKINAEDCRKVREKYLHNFDGPYIIFLSTLEPRKNLKNTINSYILLRQKNPDIPLKLVIAGKHGWGIQNIQSEIGDYSEHIFFTGFVDDDDLPYLYSEAVAMSYLSFYEGFGLPPLEAMCCGTPVIYGNNSSLIEVVGSGGLPADPYDVNDIKTQYEKIFYDTELRNRKSRAALKQSLKFSWRNTAIETLSLYGRIIDK